MAIDEGDLRRRSPITITAVPSLTESSFSEYESQPSCPHEVSFRARPLRSDSNTTLDQIVVSTISQNRLSRQSSLPWGHKPSPLIGASCFLFLLPIPLLLRACCPVSSFLLGCVTVSSYMSDHVFTGLESWAHIFDKVLAPMAFTSCLYATYSTCGLAWAAMSVAALKCHIMAKYYSKNEMYDQFVIWHSLWHAVGVGLILVAFTYNRVAGKCWEGSVWEDAIHGHIMA